MRALFAAIAGTTLLCTGATGALAQGLGSIGTTYGVPEAAAVSPEQYVPKPKQPPQMTSGALSTVGQSEGTPVAFKDPARDYTIIAPSGARFQHRGAGQPLGIQSRHGYAVNLQVGDANPDLSVRHMFAKMEGTYLGDGKPWSVKLGERRAVVAGMEAGAADYEAGSTRTRVVIARGKQTDFVFMFFAPVAQFEKLSAEFDWILTNFKPAPSELPDRPVRMVEKTAPAPTPAPLRAQAAPEPIPAGRPKPNVVSAPADTQVFAEPGYGYRVEYPDAWQLEKVSAFTNLFSGPEGSPSFEAIVAMQNVQPQGAQNARDAAEKAFVDLKSSLSRDAGRVDFVGEKVVAYVKNGLTLEGRQFVASYDHQGRRFRKWALVLPRPNGTVAHVWSYTAPMDRFDEFRPIAERMLQSLKIDGEQG